MPGELDYVFRFKFITNLDKLVAEYRAAVREIGREAGQAGQFGKATQAAGQQARSIAQQFGVDPGQLARALDAINQTVSKQLPANENARTQYLRDMKSLGGYKQDVLTTPKVGGVKLGETISLDAGTDKARERAFRAKQSALAQAQLQEQLAGDKVYTELQKRIATAKQQQQADLMAAKAADENYIRHTKNLAAARAKLEAKTIEEQNADEEYQKWTKELAVQRELAKAQEAESLATNEQYQAATLRAAIARETSKAAMAGDAKYAAAQAKTASSKEQQNARIKAALAADDKYIAASAAATLANEELAAKVTLKAAGIKYEGMGREQLLATAAVTKRTQADLQAAATARATITADERAINAAVRKSIAEAEVAAVLRNRQKTEIRAAIKAGEFSQTTGFQRAQGWLKGTSPAGEATGPAFFSQKTFQSAGYAVGGMITGAALFGTLEAVKEASKLQEQFAGLRGQMDALGQSGAFLGVRDGIKNISNETGIAASEVTKFATRLLGVFNDPARAVKETDAAMKLAVVSGTDLATMLEELVPIADLFGVSIERIGDLAISIQDKFGIAAEATLHFLGEVAPLAEEAGLSLEEMGVLGATAANTTGKSIKVAAEQFSKVLPTMQANQTKIFQILRANPQTAGRVDPIIEAFGRGESGEAFKEILKAYNDLDSVQQANLVRVSGSRREWALLNGLFSNSNKLLSDMADAEEGVGRNTGGLERRFAAVSATLSRSIERIKEGFKNMVEGFLASGLGDAFATVGQGLELVLNLVNAVVGAFVKLNELTSKIPLIGGEGLVVPLVQFTVAAIAASKAMALFNGVRQGGKDGSITVARGERQLTVEIGRRSAATAEGQATLTADAAAKERNAVVTGELASAEGTLATSRGGGIGAAGVRQMASGRYQDLTTGRIVSTRAAEEYLAAQPGPPPPTYSAGVRQMASGRYQDLSTGKIIPTASAQQYLSSLPAPPAAVAGQGAAAAATAAMAASTAAATSAEAAAAASAAASGASASAAQAAGGSAAVAAEAASGASSAASGAAATAAEASSAASTASSATSATAAEGAATASATSAATSGVANAAAGGWGAKFADSRTIQRLFSGGKFFKGTATMGAVNQGAATAGVTSGVGPFMGVALPVIAGLQVKGKFDEQKEALEQKGNEYSEQLKTVSEEDLAQLATTYSDWYDKFQESFFQTALGGTKAKMEQWRRKGAKGAVAAGVLTDRKWVDRFAQDISEERLNEIDAMLNSSDSLRRYAADELGASMEGNIADKAMGLYGKLGGNMPVGWGKGEVKVSRENLKDWLPKIKERAEKGEEGAAQMAFLIEQEINNNRSMADIRKEVQTAIDKGDVGKAIDAAGGLDQFLEVQGLYDPKGQLQTGKIGRGQYLAQMKQNVADLRKQLASAPDPEEAQKKLDQAEVEAQNVADQIVKERIDQYKRIADITQGRPKAAILGSALTNLPKLSVPEQMNQIPDLIQGRWDAFQEQLSHISDPEEWYQKASQGIDIDKQTQVLQVFKNLKDSRVGLFADQIKGSQQSQDDFFNELARTRVETGKSMRDIIYGYAQRRYAGREGSEDYKNILNALGNITDAEWAELDKYISHLTSPREILLQTKAEREAKVRTAESDARAIAGGTSPKAAAQGELDRANIELEKLLKLQEQGSTDPDLVANIQNARNNVTKAQQQVASVEHQTAAALDQWAVVFAGQDPVKRTNAELTAAINNSNRILEENAGDVTDPKYIESLQRQAELRQQQRQNQNAIARARIELAGFDSNQDPEAAARTARQLAELQLRTAEGEEARLRALLAIKEADRQSLEAAREGDKARRDLLAFDSNRDPVAEAQHAINEANIAIEEARGKGVAAAAGAQLKLKEAYRQMADAQEAILQSDAEFAIGMANIRQDPVGGATRAVEEAGRRLEVLRAQGAGTAELQRAVLDLEQKRSEAVDTAVGEQVDMIDFLLEMEEITQSQAIARLKVERDKYGVRTKKWMDLQRKINSLEKGAKADNQFNLPANIALPTLYEARRLNQSRAMGIGYMDNRSIAVTFNVNGAQDPAAVANQITNALQASLGGGQVYTPGVTVGSMN